MEQAQVPKNNTNENTEKNDETLENSDLSVDKVIDTFLHRILDIEECAQDFISIAVKKYNENSDRLRLEISAYLDVLNNEEKDDDERLLSIRGTRKASREIDRHNNSSPVATLEKSLFIYLFAAFDKYIGDLVAVLYQSQPALFKNINREISLSEALQYESMDELRLVMLDKEIEALRRKSYIEQFNDLESKFSIKLTKFDNWPYFIEGAQRRNLFTHCDGIVSKQYLDICKNVGFKFKEEPLVGDQLKIGSKYLFQSCLLITEVAVMLGHTLWRKTLPNDIENADSHLSELVFNYLHMECWKKAISVSKFALALPKISTDQIERIYTHECFP
jgi:hypothetical protein